MGILNFFKTKSKPAMTAEVEENSTLKPAKKSNWISDRVSESIGKNELSDLLVGKNNYFFSHREYPGEHDYGVILSSGIYEYFRNDYEIKQLFEDTLLCLMNGTPCDLLIAFQYIWRQRCCEFRGTAPFEIDKKILATIAAKIVEKEAELKSYKERYEFGSELQDGAWEHIHNIVNSIETEYNSKMF